MGLMGLYKHSAGQLKLKILENQVKYDKSLKARDLLMLRSLDHKDPFFVREYNRLSKAISEARRNLGFYRSLLAEIKT